MKPVNVKKIPTLPTSPQILETRDKWEFNGTKRPNFVEPAAKGKSSVWDFPRPPRIEPVSQVLRVFHNQTVIAQTQGGVRVLETAGAPTYYFPPHDVDPSTVQFGEMASICEWKGVAQSITVDGVADAGWRYVRMFEEFIDLFEWPSFYPGKLLCFVDTEQVKPQPGGYYGGWVTDDLTGPIKGEPGSETW